MNDMPNATDIHEHITGMLDGKLGKLAREIAEETGIDVLPEPTTSLQIGFGYYYIFDIEEDYPLCPRDKKEIMNTMWATIEEMQELDTNADVSQFVRMLQE